MPWYRRLSYASSYRFASDRDGRTGRRAENTYRLEPSVDERFYPCYTEPIIAHVLQVWAQEIALYEIALYVVPYHATRFY